MSWPKIGPQFGLTLYNFRFVLAWPRYSTVHGEASDPRYVRSRTLDVKRYSMHTGQSDSKARSTQTCEVREATV